MHTINKQALERLTYMDMNIYYSKTSPSTGRPGSNLYIFHF